MSRKISEDYFTSTAGRSISKIKAGVGGWSDDERWKIS